MCNSQEGPSDHDKLCAELGISVTSTPAETEAEALRVIDDLRLERVGIWHSLGKWFKNRTLLPPDDMVSLAADARGIALQYGEREHTRAETFRRERDAYVTRDKIVKRLKSDINKVRRERDAYKKSKEENDERFMTERDKAKHQITENDRLRELNRDLDSDRGKLRILLKQADEMERITAAKLSDKCPLCKE